MKIFKFMVVVLVAICGLNSCSDDCDHNYIEYDYNKALVGTWTCIEPENEFAEALVIKADSSLEVTGVVGGEYFESNGTIHVVNNKMTYKLDNGDELEGRFEMVAGESFSMMNSISAILIIIVRMTLLMKLLVCGYALMLQQKMVMS